MILPSGAFDRLADHDHQVCMDLALERAEALCRAKQLRLTPVRRRVLKLLWRSHQPVGAYQLLEELQRHGRATPPTVYRALDFLLQAGLVHRIATLNAFIGCPRPEHPHHGPFLICRSCQLLVELTTDRVSRVIDECTSAAGFSVSEQTIEILGRCPRCAERAL